MRDMVFFNTGDLFAGIYRIERLIASGGFADVYKGQRLATGDDVAIKVMQHRHAMNARARERMVAETEVLKELQHENVVRVIDGGFHDSVLFMVMEYLPGRTLRDVMLAEGGPLPVLRALYIVRETGDGVSAAHAMRVIHRDLKPENVMVSNRDEVKVLDIGAGKFFGRGLQTTGQGPIVGTPLYMSPEHIRGDPPVDVRTDVYALGVILYEMLTHRHPFAPSSGEMPSRFELPTIILNGTPLPPSAIVPGLPRHIDSLVAKAIAKDRNDRYETAEAFTRAVREAALRHAEENGMTLTVRTARADKPPGSAMIDAIGELEDARTSELPREPSPPLRGLMPSAFAPKSDGISPPALTMELSGLPTPGMLSRR